MKVILLSCTLLVGLIGADHVHAQVNEKFADMSAEIQQLRDLAQKERKSAVTDSMGFTPAESAAFWPVYDKYRAQMKTVNDKLVKVITDYAAQRDTMSDEQGRKLVDEFLRYQSEQLKVRRDYVGKFGKVLSGQKLARFYQVENKLDILSDLSMANQIPLVK